MRIEKTKKNYKVEIVFLDENNKEVFNANTNTNLIEEMYGIGVAGLQELYNSAVKSFNDTKTPEEMLKGFAASELSGIEKSKVERPLEDSFITNNVDKWLEEIIDLRRLSEETSNYIKSTYSDLLSNELNYDYEIIKNAKLYALNDIFSYKGKAIACKTYMYDTMEELKEFLKDKQYALYFVQQYTTSGIPNPNPLSISPFVEGKWPKIRYIFKGVILDEQKTN